MHNYKELKVWQNSRKLVKEVYLLTLSIPDQEKFGLTNQIRRSAVSIPSNIAEGAGRGTTKEFSRFINISLGSAYELETQLILASDLQYIDLEKTETIISILQEIQKILYSLSKKFSLEENLKSNV
jgi:four helix bundle protein